MIYTDEEQFCPLMAESKGKYTGEWKDDKRHGRGTMVWKSGVQYTGNFRNDRRHNVEGKITFISGDVYDGHWFNELMHGPGVYTKRDEDLGETIFIFRGKFQYGQPPTFGALEDIDSGN